MGRLPGPSSGRGRQASCHEADHGPFDHGFGMGGQAFVVAVESSPAHQPGQGSFHHPTARQNLESVLPLGFPHDLERDPAVPGDPGNQLARVATVGPDQRDRRHRHPRAVEDAAPAVAVLQAGRGHQHDDEQAQRVDDDVSLAPLTFLPAS